MNSTITYTEAPELLGKRIQEGEILPDFLPPPEQLEELIRIHPKVKITITLNSRSVNFYKQYAAEHNIKYQTMINEILDLYAQKYQDRLTT